MIKSVFNLIKVAFYKLYTLQKIINLYLYDMKTLYIHFIVINLNNAQELLCLLSDQINITNKNNILKTLN